MAVTPASFRSPAGELFNDMFPGLSASDVDGAITRWLADADGTTDDYKTAQVYVKAYGESIRRFAVQPEKLDVDGEGAVNNARWTLPYLQAQLNTWERKLESFTKIVTAPVFATKPITTTPTWG